MELLGGGKSEVYAVSYKNSWKAWVVDVVQEQYLQQIYVVGMALI